MGGVQYMRKAPKGVEERSARACSFLMMACGMCRRWDSGGAGKPRHEGSWGGHASRSFSVVAWRMCARLARAWPRWPRDWRRSGSSSWPPWRGPGRGSDRLHARDSGEGSLRRPSPSWPRTTRFFSPFPWLPRPSPWGSGLPWAWPGLPAQHHRRARDREPVRRGERIA
jgi:hypothetical protein